MKVSELIDILKHMDQDLPVYSSYEYGDYWGSIVADEISDVEELELVYSAYHQRMSVPDENEEPDEHAEKEPVLAIVLS